MSFFQILIAIVASFAGLGLAVGGCGYGYSSFKNGKNKYKDELILDLKATITQREDTISGLNEEKSQLLVSHQNQITELQKEIKELQRVFSEQQGKLKTYEAILENRDPKTIELLNSIKEGIDSLNGHQFTSEKQTKQVAVTLKETNK